MLEWLRDVIHRRGARIAAAMVAVVIAVLAARSIAGPEVKAAKVTRRDVVETLVVNGRVFALQKSDIGAQTAGTVADVLVDKGSRVRKGDVLLRLDSREESAKATQARASVAEARARLDSVRRLASNEAEANYRKAESTATTAERELKRAESLHAEGLMSTADLEEKRSIAVAARQDAESARARLASIADTEERGGRAALDQAQAGFEAENVRLAKTEIRAPGDGTVLLRNVQPGDSVQPGESLVVLALDSPTLLVADPDERNLPLLHVGAQARASADAYPNESFPATVSFVAPSIDQQRGTVEVRLSVADPPEYLRTDMTVSVEIITGSKNAALVVPALAVHDVAGAPWVLVVRRHRATKQPLKLGVRGDEYLEVLSGLSEGEPVVLLSEPVKQGSRVRADVSSR